ncbi:MAG: AAA family ATPase [Candidatus Margulisbacteria bacterium]|jgi:stage III sporulation protein AA|nr:AAA family ATPase [Candidatus Margulisiibacteriota bacterium]
MGEKSHINKITDNLDQLLDLLPQRVTKLLKKQKSLGSLREVVLDLGREPEFRFSQNEIMYIENDIISQGDIDYVVSKIGQFNDDNRAGIERTLHRISCIRNRMGRIIGLTCRVGRSIYGTIDIISDIVSSGKSLLIMGGPGIGKTTMLREIARVLSTDYGKRVVVVDTSNEIAGDGDIAHPAIGRARRMQVTHSTQQHAVMIEAVENHMPQVVIVDEIGTEEEAKAARTIAERGVQLIGTAHGNNIENLLKNPTLSDLVGGIQSVILGDEEAKRRNSQKTILERKAPPTFQVLVELNDRHTLGIYRDIALTVDALLAGKKPKPEIRKQELDGSVLIVQKEAVEVYNLQQNLELDEEAKQKLKNDLLVDKRVGIYAFGINRERLAKAIKMLSINARAATHIDEADIVLTTKAHNKPNSNLLRSLHDRKIPVNVIKSDTTPQITRFLKYVFKLYNDDAEKIQKAIDEIEEIIKYVDAYKSKAEATQTSAYLRRLQKQVCVERGFRCESIGDEPNRRVRVYPKQ